MSVHDRLYMHLMNAFIAYLYGSLDFNIYIKILDGSYYSILMLLVNYTSSNYKDHYTG